MPPPPGFAKTPGRARRVIVHSNHLGRRFVPGRSIFQMSKAGRGAAAGAIRGA